MHCGGTGGCRGSIPQVIAYCLSFSILIVNILIIYNSQVVAYAYCLSFIMIITILIIFNLQLLELPHDQDDHQFFDHL